MVCNENPQETESPEKIFPRWKLQTRESHLLQNLSCNAGWDKNFVPREMQ